MVEFVLTVGRSEEDWLTSVVRRGSGRWRWTADEGLSIEIDSPELVPTLLMR